MMTVLTEGVIVISKYCVAVTETAKSINHTVSRNNTKSLKEPLTSSRFNFFVVELPFILSIHIVKRSDLQPTRLQGKPGSQLLQLRLLLVLEEIAMLSHLNSTKTKRPIRKCNHAGCGTSRRDDRRIAVALPIREMTQRYKDTSNRRNVQNGVPDGL